MNKIKTCDWCKWNKTDCLNFETSACYPFEPSDPEAYAAAVMLEIKSSVVPSSEKRLKRNCITTNGLTHDDRYTLDEYHVTYINSVLSQIRSGNEDYVYSIDNLKELYAFEQGLKIRWQDGCWIVTKEDD